eukprot:gene3928-7138_t
MSEFIEKEAHLSEDEEIEKTKNKNEDDDEDSENDDNVEDKFDYNDGFLVDDEEDDVDSKKHGRDDDDEVEKKKPKKLRRLTKKSEEAPKVIVQEIVQKEKSYGLDFLDEEDEDEEEEPKRRKDDFIVGEIVDDEQVEQDEKMGDAMSVFGNYDFSEFFDEEEGEIEDEEEIENEDKFKKLKEHFEPEVLASSFMTDFDEKIKKTDKPERFQLRQPSRGKVTDDDIEIESYWIFDQSFSKKIEDIAKKEIEELGGSIYGTQEEGTFYETFEEKKEQCISAIKEVLKLILIEFCDIPFISNYRKETFEHILTNDIDLWKISDLDDEWEQLNKKKQELTTLYNQTDGIDLLYIDMLKNAKTKIEINDLSDHYKKFFGSKKMSKKLPENQKKYSIFKKLKIGEFVKLFGLTSTQFADNLESLYQKNQVKDYSKEPLIAAFDFITSDFKTEELILKASRHIYAYEISNEPIIKRKIRNVFEMNSLITTIPTKKGTTCTIKEYKNILAIQNIPITDFKKSNDSLKDFLYIIKAERDGFLKLSISIDDSLIDQTLDIQSTFFSSNFDNDVCKLWNEQRELVIQEVKQILKKPMEQYIKTLYLKESKKIIEFEVSKNMKNLLNVGPYQKKKNSYYSINDQSTSDFEEYEPYTVLSCCKGNESEKSCFSFLNENGKFIDKLEWEYSNRIEKKKKDQFFYLKKFIEKYKPDYIVVGTGNGFEDKKFYEDILYIYRTSNQIEDIDENPEDKIFFVSSEISKIYEHSSFSNQDFPSFNNTIKRSISIGRKFQNPIGEISRLFNFEKDILYLKLNFLQDLLSKDELLKTIEREFIRSISKIGIDINQSISYDHLNSMIQFLSGLGPRKAKDFIENLKNYESSFLEEREKLLKDDLLTENIYKNVAGFLKINYDSQEVILDSTRIHPESYTLALKIATDALDDEQEEEEEEEDNILVQKIMKNSNLLDDLDLDAYAEELASRNLGKKSITLKDIKKELKYPFKDDSRIPFKKYSSIELFYHLTGETKETFFEDLIITVVVKKITRDFVICELENGCEGRILLNSMSDDYDEPNPFDLFQIGLNVECVIERINFDNLLVELNSKESIIREKMEQEFNFKHKRRNGFDDDSNYNRKRIKRNVNHPLFKNFDFEESKNYLKTHSIGDLIIRPSSKGFDHLTITYKFFENVYVNLDILEKNKKDPFSLGEKLIIENQEFDDLDEIIARYIEPIIDHIKNLLNHQKFINKSEDEIKKSLIKQKQINSQIIPYAVGIDHKRSGRFNIYYVPGLKRVKLEHIGVNPDGFSFLKRNFSSPNKLFNAFKKSYKELASLKYSRNEEDEEDSYDRRRKSSPENFGQW